MAASVGGSGVKNRRERLKEARLEKKKRKFDSWSWVQHHKRKNTMINHKAKEKELITRDSKRVSKTKFEEYMDMETRKNGREALRNTGSSHKRTVAYDQINTPLEPMRKKKTKFEKYLELENQTSAKEDIALERKLAKVGADGDETINMLLEGIPSVFDLLETEENTDVEEDSNINISSKKNSKSLKRKLDLVAAENKSHDLVVELETKHEKNNDQASIIRKHVKGLINRLVESNLEVIAGEMYSIFMSISGSDDAQIISEEILKSAAPRGNEQYAAVFAALVSGLACLVGIDFGAKLLASLAKCFEDEYQKEYNLSLRNLTLLLSYLYKFGVCSSYLIYDFMMMLSSRLTEVDVSTILTVLNCCGMRLRRDDPATMKILIDSIQNNVKELKAAAGDSQENTRSKRMEFMLETIFDIKNNKKKDKDDTVQHSRIKKWLQKLGVENILVRGTKWNKLLDPEKKGQWWLPGEIMPSTTNSNNNIENFAKKMYRESSEAQKMQKLAARLGMNTYSRRAIFYIIAWAEDYIDAFEKLLKLNLQGMQDREIMRVLVVCCLEESVFNKYYCVLASKLCAYDRNHKFTLQCCIWDHYTQLESMKPQRSMHLAKFVAEMVSGFTLSLSVLKKADLHDIRKLPSTKEHFEMFFEAVFEYADNMVWNIFTRIAGSPQYEYLRTGIKLFIEMYVVGNQKQFARKYKIAKKALNNVEQEEDPFL